MSPKTSPTMAEDEDTRGCRGCFGWLFKLFKRMKRRIRPKKKNALQVTESLEVNEEKDKSVALVNSVAVLTEEKGQPEASESVMTVAEITEAKDAEEHGQLEAVGEERQKEQDDEQLVEEQQEPQVVTTWAEEVDEAEEKGLDVFASKSSCLPHTAIVPCEISASSPQKEATAAAASQAKVSASQKRRARRKALHAATVNSEARLAATAEEPPRQDRTHVWPSPSVRVFGSDGRPFVTTWEEAAYGAFRAQRHY